MTIVKGDVSNYSHVFNVIKQYGIDVIYHLGSMLSVPSDADPWSSFRVNAQGFHVLEAARILGVKKVTFSSTLATYGLDIREAVVDDYTLQRPNLFYGCTKVFVELMGRFYRRKFGIDFRGVRYPAIIGPGVKTPGVVQYYPWAIEHAYRGLPFKIWVTPEFRAPPCITKMRLWGLSSAPKLLSRISKWASIFWGLFSFPPRSSWTISKNSSRRPGWSLRRI